MSKLTPLIDRIGNLYTELEKKTLFQYLAVILLIFLAAALRFYKLGAWSFWGDEMFTVGGREDGFNYTVLRQSISLELIQAAVAYLGANEWNARLVPALIGIISLPILYFPLKKMFNARVSLVTLLLLAISPWHLYWSQNARFYVALLLFYSLALFIFYLGLEEDRPLYFLVSLILLGLAVKERLIALFFVPVVLSYLGLLYILPFEKPVGLRWRNLAIFFVPPSLILALFFMGPYILNLSGWLEGFGRANNNPLWLVAGIVYYVGLPTACAGILGAIYLLSQKSRAALLLSLNLVIPIVILMAISSFHYTANRYAFISLISWLALAAVAAVELLTQAQRHTKVLALAILMVLLVDAFSANLLYYRYQNGNRDDWKGAFALIKEHEQPGDLVVTMNPELADYYLQDQTVPFKDFDLSTINEEEKRVWFVEDITLQDYYPDTISWLEENTRLVGNLDIQVQARNFKMRIYLFEPETVIDQALKD